jgi:hypothetical protein
MLSVPCIGEDACISTLWGGRKRLGSTPPGHQADRDHCDQADHCELVANTPLSAETREEVVEEEGGEDEEEEEEGARPVTRVCVSTCHFGYMNSEMTVRLTGVHAMRIEQEARARVKDSHAFNLWWD